MVHTLSAADTSAVLELLHARPLQNVVLEYVVRQGGLGALPSFLGFEQNGRLDGILLVAGNGSTALEVRSPAAFEPLARGAASLPTPPLHIVGAEDITAPFWEALRPWAAPTLWSRREPFYLLTRLHAQRWPSGEHAAEITWAREADLRELVENSAEQFREDLKLDRQAEDPTRFRERHRQDVLEGRWWVLRTARRIAFQVHVGAANDSAVQIGGVFTPRDLRRRGFALRGLRALLARLLESHPAVCLYCDEANTAARRLYEKLLFERVLWYRSWLLRGQARRGQ